MNGLLLVLLFLLLGGCSSNTNQVIAPVPVEDRSIKEAENSEVRYPHVETEAGVIRGNDAIEGRKSQSSSKVTVALLADAEIKLDSGDNSLAAVIVERALRLEPNNPLLWHKLGLIRLKQKNWQQAINMARKSNSLAAGDYSLQSENWQLIANAREAAGNKKAAQDARKRAMTLGGRDQ